MIFSTLKEELSARNYNPFGISKATGIPRSFVQGLFTNNFKLLNVEYLDKLCEYLAIPMTDFIHYYPFDIKIKFVDDKEVVVEMTTYPTLETKIGFDFLDYEFVEFHLEIKKKGEIPIINIKQDDFENWCSWFGNPELRELTNWVLREIQKQYREKFSYSSEEFVFTLRTILCEDIDE